MSRRKKKGEDINTNGWMDTYADTITLLLTFFILLYSISVVDSQKLNKLAEAMKKSLQGSTKITELENIENLKVGEGKSDYENLAEKLNTVIEQNALTDVVKIREEERGVVLQLDETILFDSGEAVLKDYSRNILNTITTVIKNIDNDVLIEGNTDNIPINNEYFKSNWELSTARTVSIVRYFVETKEINPTRFSVKGYAEYKPLVENNTEENRSINRRVDILIVEQKEK
ncbi:OmpA/MotB family protein [Asaccharospora irregularis]|uniref:Chemotaxis protein MotB n=1 Tax=Asaccharospora irregularis DSM 2635 TaxID=1121321 RepID=A0A1M5NDR2_9FIRM|nr:flagellar motor protein MotB [Asaccharospora irregularis]SHG87648.1 chemotaxis protein MotB [Asaccharospora irregularis DSM 2635]